VSADVVDIADARAARERRQMFKTLLAFGLLFALVWAGRGQ
jgi:hypothetical protein